MNKKWIAIIASVVVLMIGGRLLVDYVESSRETDEQKILKVIERTKSAAQQKNVGAIMNLISEKFKGQGMNEQQIRVFLNQYLKKASNIVVSYSPPDIKINGTKADVTFANMTVTFDNEDLGPQTYKLEPLKVSLEKEEIRRYLFFKDNEWHFVTADQIPGANTPLGGF